MQAMLRAIANPTRRGILHLVWQEEMPARTIAGHFDVSWPAVSQNLKVLKDAGLLVERRHGVQRFYRANQEASQPIEALLRAMWEEDLLALKNLIESDHDKS